MNKYHQEILKEIRKIKRKWPVDQVAFVKRYLGTDKEYYPLKAEDSKKIARQFLKKYPLISSKEFFAVVDSLFGGKTHQEMCLAGRLLNLASAKSMKDFDPQSLEKWLNRTVGWCEVDSLCSNNFTAEQMLKKWKEWRNLLDSFSRDRDVHKRRASVVLLVRATRESDDSRLARVAFVNTDRLKSEKDVLITKAISWILRSLIKYHKKEVADYLKENHDKLPKIAVREAQMKLVTGRKTKRK